MQVSSLFSLPRKEVSPLDFKKYGKMLLLITLLIVFVIKVLFSDHLKLNVATRSISVTIEFHDDHYKREE